MYELTLEDGEIQQTTRLPQLEKTMNEWMFVFETWEHPRSLYIECLISDGKQTFMMIATCDMRDLHLTVDAIDFYTQEDAWIAHHPLLKEAAERLIHYIQQHPKFRLFFITNEHTVTIDFLRQ